MDRSRRYEAPLTNYRSYLTIMTTFVLPGDVIPLPADPVDPSVSHSITFGPGIGASTSRDGSSSSSVAMKMGQIHNSAKRRKTKEGPSEVNRLWVDVQSKRVRARCDSKSDESDRDLPMFSLYTSVRTGAR